MEHLPTCILGMHRSGTSVVSRLVNLLGVDLGPERALLAATADNPKGYWEHGGIVRINDEILERFGGRWDDVPSWPASWLRDSRLEELRDRARLLVDGDFPPHGRCARRRSGRARRGHRLCRGESVPPPCFD